MGNTTYALIRGLSTDQSFTTPCRTMVTQLVEKERIRTTLPKALALRRVADKAVGLGKEVSTSCMDFGKRWTTSGTDVSVPAVHAVPMPPCASALFANPRS